MEANRGHDLAATARPYSNVTSHSTWHSPVPYLFGGLAAMLGLIAFALLILACSYWKLSGYLDSAAGEADEEAGEADVEAGKKPPPPQAELEEKILVIMAGEVKPTFLATPASSRSSSFADVSTRSCGCAAEKLETAVESNDEKKYCQGSSGQHSR